MHKQKLTLRSDQTGLAHLAIVAVIVVAVAIGLVGWRMTQSKDKTSDSKTDTTQTTGNSETSADTDETTGSSSAKFLTIKEWGVKFALTTATADAYYDTKTNSSLDSMSLRSHALDSEADCTNSPQAVASIFRVPKDAVDEQTGKKYSEAGDGQTVGDYYYFIQSSQYMCTEDTEKAILLQGIRNSFNTAGPSIVKS